jgi:hypothetical protein
VKQPTSGRAVRAAFGVFNPRTGPASASRVAYGRRPAIEDPEAQESPADLDLVPIAQFPTRPT